jgi:hypothetical protein
MAVSVVDTNEAVQTKNYTLNSTHRCDRCGAQAYLRVYLTNGFDLLFCGHHYGRNKTAMSALIDSVVDERDRLNEGNRHKGSEHS